jgi:hypothetical protein
MVNSQLLKVYLPDERRYRPSDAGLYGLSQPERAAEFQTLRHRPRTSALPTFGSQESGKVLIHALTGDVEKTTSSPTTPTES